MKGKYLTEKERYLIEAWLLDKVPVKEIAKRLGRCQATIYNEIKRGTVEMIDSKYLRPYRKYCADHGQMKREQAKKNKGVKLKAADDVQLLSYISDLIVNKRLSPYAVAVMLQRKHVSKTLCEKSIYNYVRRGLIPGASVDQMAYKRRTRKSHDMIRRVPRKAIYPCISDRDKDILKRSELGHWEMDTVYSGKDTSKDCLLVLTERMSRSELIFRMPDRSAASTVKALDKIERKLGRTNFKHIFKTITCDNGGEFMDYEGITKRNRTKLYYCHPYCSSERGSNENQNKLIRRWIPKGDDIRLYTDKEILEIQNWINALPRKMFGGMSSSDIVNVHKEYAEIINS